MKEHTIFGEWWEVGGGGFERKFGPCARVSQDMGKVKGHRFLQFQHPRKLPRERWETRWGWYGKEKSYAILLTRQLNTG